MMTVINAMGAVQLRGAIVRNMAFDRVLIPVSSAFTRRSRSLRVSCSSPS